MGPHGQFISKILAVDPEKLIVDYGGGIRK